MIECRNLECWNVDPWVQECLNLKVREALNSRIFFTLNVGEKWLPEVWLEICSNGRMLEFRLFLRNLSIFKFFKLFIFVLGILSPRPIGQVVQQKRVTFLSSTICHSAPAFASFSSFCSSLEQKIRSQSNKRNFVRNSSKLVQIFLTVHYRTLI